VVAFVLLNDRPHVNLAGKTLPDEGQTVVEPGAGTAPNVYAMAEAYTDTSVANLEGMSESLLALHTPEENLLIQGLPQE
jgi:hypothetical protein